MIDYKDYFIIQGYIKTGDMESLKAYLEKEKKKFYLKEAREALFEYVACDTRSLYVNFDDKIVISDGYTGFYILNSDEVLNAQIRKKCGGYAIGSETEIRRKKNIMAITKSVLDGDYELIKKTTSKIGKVSVDSENRKRVIITSEDNKVSHTFQKRLYDESLKILGEDTIITIGNNKKDHCYLAKSPKGLCLTMGIKK